MIFNIFKSKPTLKELIPNGFVDIHSHILPGIDDGAKNMEESLSLIQKMKDIGFSKIIGTPHTYPGLYNNSNESIEKSFKSIKNNGIDGVKVSYASEYMLDTYLISKARNNNLICLKDKYVLVEMSYLSAPENLYEIIFELKVNRYIPVLAHPERYIFLKKNFNEYYKLKKFGCYFQLNLLSATNFYGPETTKILDKLLKRELIDFVGSDIHKPSHIIGFEKKLKINNIKSFRESIERNNFFCD